MTGTQPGLEIFSEEWINTVGTGIEPALKCCVLELCRAFQLGNSTDPDMVASILSKHLAYWQRGFLYVEHGCTEIDQPGAFK